MTDEKASKFRQVCASIARSGPSLALGVAVGVAATLLVQRFASGETRPALREDVAWEGWGGAAVGAVISVALAVWVLHRTLRHERESFKASLTSSMDLAAEERRVQAFAEVARHLQTFISKPEYSAESMESLVDASNSAWIWAMHVRPQDEEFRDEFANGLRLLYGASAENWPVAASFAISLQMAGVVWHKPGTSSEHVIAKLRERTAAAKSEMEALSKRSGAPSDPDRANPIVGETASRSKLLRAKACVRRLFRKFLGR